MCSFNYEVLPGVAVDPALPANTCMPSTEFNDAAIINAAAYRRCVDPAVVGSKSGCAKVRGCYWNESSESAAPLIKGFAVQCLPIWTQDL